MNSADALKALESTLNAIKTIGIKSTYEDIAKSHQVKYDLIKKENKFQFLIKKYQDKLKNKSNIIKDLHIKKLKNLPSKYKKILLKNINKKLNKKPSEIPKANISEDEIKNIITSDNELDTK